MTLVPCKVPNAWTLLSTLFNGWEAGYHRYHYYWRDPHRIASRPEECTEYLYTYPGSYYCTRRVWVWVYMFMMLCSHFPVFPLDYHRLRLSNE